MNILRKLDVRARLVSAFLIVIVGCSAIGLFGFLQAKTQLESMASNGRKLASSEISLKAWNDAIFLNFTRSNIIIEGDDVALLSRLQADLKATSAEVDVGQSSVEKALSTDELKNEFQAVKKNRKAYTELRKEAFEAYADGQVEEARVTWVSKAVPAAKKYSESVRSLSERVVTVEAARIEGELAYSQNMQTMMVFGLAGAMVASLLLAVGVSRSITLPLLRVQDALMGLKDGFLGERPVEAHDDLPGRLELALRDTAASLRATIVEVSSNAAAVNSSSQEIAHGTMDLSARTEATAASLEESASAIEEVTATVEANAQTCAAAKEQAQKAVLVSAQAQEVVSKVAGTMRGIETASQSITGVLALIDSIAFQTNILALNAAVEAARAGEQGRGFAVVATEVRSLAARSAEAAKEIKGIVDDTLSKVHAGTELSATAGTVMADVANAMDVMRNHMDDIARSSREQAMGLAEISKAISVLDSSTQQNAALVEESSAAASALQENASRLEGLTRSFQT